MSRASIDLYITLCIRGVKRRTRPTRRCISWNNDSHGHDSLAGVHLPTTAERAIRKVVDAPVPVEGAQ
jgi:hypothetical protein